MFWKGKQKARYAARAGGRTDYGKGKGFGFCGDVQGVRQGIYGVYVQPEKQTAGRIYYKRDGRRSGAGDGGSRHLKSGYPGDIPGRHDRTVSGYRSPEVGE